MGARVVAGDGSEGRERGFVGSDARGEQKIRFE
jgi:hypothetical protein